MKPMRKALSDGAVNSDSHPSEHGGNVRALAAIGQCRAEDLLDFSANINPLGPPVWLASHITDAVSSLVHYPDPACTDLLAATAARYRVAPSEVLAGNGSTELIYLLPRAIEPSRVLIPVPAYSDYAKAAQAARIQVETISLREEDRFALDMNRLKQAVRAGDLVFLGHPNNPSGTLLPGNRLRSLAELQPEALFVIDEAFGDFVEGFDSLTARRPPNVVVLLSLTKAFAIPGLRLGLAVADREIAEPVRALQPAWSVNSLAQSVGVAALADTEYLASTRCYVCAQRNKLLACLRELDALTVYPGTANFLLVRLDRGGSASALSWRLLRKGIAIRTCHNIAGLDDRFFRVAVRTSDENAKLLATLDEEFG